MVVFARQSLRTIALGLGGLLVLAGCNLGGSNTTTGGASSTDVTVWSAWGGSELKAFHAHPSWRPEIDEDGLAAYFRYGWVPAPRSIYRGVQKLPPGHILTLRSGGEPVLRAYWSARIAAGEAAQSPWSGRRLRRA